MVEKTKVYVDKYKLKYGSANVPDMKNKPKEVEKQQEIEPSKPQTEMHMVNETRPFDYNDVNLMKAKFSKREIARNRMITEAHAIGDMGLVKTLEAESRSEQKELQEVIFKANANRKIGQAIDRDIRNMELREREEAEEQSEFDREFGYDE